MKKLSAMIIVILIVMCASFTAHAEETVSEWEAIVYGEGTTYMISGTGTIGNTNFEWYTDSEDAHRWNVQGTSTYSKIDFPKFSVETLCPIINDVTGYVLTWKVDIASTKTGWTLNGVGTTDIAKYIWSVTYDGTTYTSSWWGGGSNTIIN